MTLPTLPPSAADDYRERELRVSAPEPACFVAMEHMHDMDCRCPECDSEWNADGLDHDEGQAALNSRAYLGERGCV